MVDARQNQIWFGTEKLVNTEFDAIDRRTAASISLYTWIQIAFKHANGVVNGDSMPHSRLRFVWSEYMNLTKRFGDLYECRYSFRTDAVVVGDEDLRCTTIIHGLKLVKYRLENAKFEAMSEKIKWLEPQQRYAFCALSVVPVREEPKDSAQQVTQLLFGEPVEILAHGQPWLKIRSFLDAYEGFIDHKQVLALTEKELRRWLDASIYSNQHYQTINGPIGLQNLSGGSLIGSTLAFSIGDFNYTSDHETTAIEGWDYAMSFLNTPYLWGGKSIFGIDCSGFVQNVYRQLDFNLPRDAHQQAEIGNLVAFEDRQLLDLAFFKNADGKIHHVGLVSPDGQILHASGQVRLDNLTAEGIYNEAAADFTHSLFEIRRLF